MGMQRLGPGSPTTDMWAGNTGVVPQGDKRDIKAKTQPVQVTGERGRQGTETYVDIKGPSGVGMRSKTPYSAALPKYRKSAEQAIDRQEIPKSQQKRVRDYFDSLGGKR